MDPDAYPYDEEIEKAVNRFVQELDVVDSGKLASNTSYREGVEKGGKAGSSWRDGDVAGLGQTQMATLIVETWPYVDVHLGGRPYKALLDCGAQVPIFRRSV